MRGDVPVSTSSGGEFVLHGLVAGPRRDDVSCRCGELIDLVALELWPCHRLEIEAVEMKAGDDSACKPVEDHRVENRKPGEREPLGLEDQNGSSVPARPRRRNPGREN